MLFNEIKNILIPIFNDLKDLISNRQVKNAIEELEMYERYVYNIDSFDSIQELRDAIKIEKSNFQKDFDLSILINDIGLLSLMGRLESGERSLDSSRLLKFSKVIELKSEAEKFLTSGSEVGIFFPYNPATGTSEWKDSLIADGCIALRLIYDLSRINKISSPKDTVSFLETLNILKEKNSIYILNLALDEETLTNLVELNIKFNIN